MQAAETKRQRSKTRSVEPESSSPSSLPTLWIAAVLALLAGSISIILRPLEIRDADVFWHLATGRWILAHHAIPVLDPFSHTASAVAWIDHEWLFQIGLRGLQVLGGLTLLFYAKAALYLSAFVLMGFYARQEADEAIAPVAAACLCMDAAFPFSEYRPVMVSMVLLGAAMAGARRAAAGDKVAAACLFVLFALWANVHATFMLGLLCLVIFLAYGACRRKVAWQYALVVACGCCLATLINPYGVHLWSVPGRVAGSRLFMNANQEWRPPDVSEEFIGFYVLLGLTVLLALWKRQRLSRPEVLFAALLAIASFKSRRIIPYCTVAVVPVLAGGLAAVPVFSRNRQRWACSFTVLAIVAGGAYAWQFRQIGGPIVPGPDDLLFINGAFPDHCARTLRDSGNKGNLFNDYNHGGYLHYALGPDWKVFIDGRNDLFGESITRSYNDTALAGGDWAALLEKSGVSAVIISYETAEHRPNLALALAADADKWAFVDFDDAGMLAVKRASFPAAWIAEHEFRLYRPMLIYDELRDGLAASGKLSALESELERRCASGRCRIAEQTLALVLLDMGQPQRAQEIIKQTVSLFGNDPVSDAILQPAGRP